MDEKALLAKEEEITTQYRDFLDEVREAFNKHCDEIKAAAEKKLAEIPETDQEGRERIMDEQKAQLDITLIELKQLLARREREVRIQLEHLNAQRELQDFNVDEALAQFGTNEQK